MIVRPVAYQLVRPTPCFDCRCFPCICETVVEPRSERCLCGGVIYAGGGPSVIAAAVLVHVRSTAHEQWAIAAGWR